MQVSINDIKSIPYDWYSLSTISTEVSPPNEDSALDLFKKTLLMPYGFSKASIIALPLSEIYKFVRYVSLKESLPPLLKEKAEYIEKCNNRNLPPKKITLVVRFMAYCFHNNWNWNLIYEPELIIEVKADLKYETILW